MTAKPIVLFDIDHTLFDTQKYWDSKLSEFHLHPEVPEVLKKLSSHVTIGIFSEGEVAFQMEKLKQTGIYDLFDKNNIHVSTKKIETLPELLEMYKGKKIYLVDDKLTVLFDAHLINDSVATIWVKRGYFAVNQKDIDGFSPNATVDNLHEVVKVVLETK